MREHAGCLPRVIRVPKGVKLRLCVLWEIRPPPQTHFNCTRRFALASLICVFCSFPKKKKKIRWNKIFKSRIIQTVALYGNTSFMVVIAILVFLLIGTFIPRTAGFAVVCVLPWKRAVRPRDSTEPGGRTGVL